MVIKKYFLIPIILWLVVCFFPQNALALTPGALVYRTSSEGRMYGYSGDNLLEIDNKGILKHIYPGHVGIYIGQENGEDYIVEALAGGIVKTPAKYFVNEALGEKLLGAKLPKNANNIEIAKAIKIAKSLVGTKLGYDFDFKKQKGPDDGDWTCVGLTEKIYESAGISNPNNLGALEYNSDYYAVDITPDGFDNTSLANSDGDCFSKTLEFSKIERRTDLQLPLPEIVGFNAGVEYQGDRYIFLPYTQFLQSTLKSEKTDIVLGSNFNDKDVRGKTPVASLILRWSLINNPISSLKTIAQATIAPLISLKDKIFGIKKGTEVVLENNIIKDESQFIESEKDIAVDQPRLPKIEINQTDITTQDDPAIKALAAVAEEDVKDEERGVTMDSESAVIIASASTVKSSVMPSLVNNKNNTPTKTAIAINNNVNNTNTNQTSSAVKASVSKLVSSVSSPAVANLTKSVPQLIAATSKISAGVKPAGNQSVATTTSQSANSSSFNTPLAVINKIYSTENNDFIELYNPTNYDFDLAEAGFRLEKAKTAVDPSLVMRIGNVSDGIYPGGTIIKARGYYLIVRDDANSYYKNKADAIAIRNDFSWTDSGYIIYLGKGALSSSSDEDIIDAVGFGESTYFQGAGSAPKIEDNYILDRIKSSGNNSTDFNLIVSDDPGIVWDESVTNENNTNTNSNGNTNNNTQANDNEADSQSANPDLFVAPTPINSSGISDLWHFDECYGVYNYAVGRFGCSIDVGYINPNFSKQLSSNIDLNKFSVSFYYRSPKLNYALSRLTLKLRNDSGQELKIMLDEAMLEVEGLPNSVSRYYDANIYPDNLWHQFTLVIDQGAGYWAIYFDGQEKYKNNFIQTLANNFSSLEISGDVGPASLDELVFWNRSLSKSEIITNFQSLAPFAPVFARESQKIAELKYFWNFNEGHELVNEGGGLKAVDKLQGVNLILPENSWVWRGLANTAISNRWDNKIGVDLPTPLDSKDLSLSFWWRSKLPPLEGRSAISLKYNDGLKMNLAPDFYRRNYYFQGYNSFGEGNNIDLPYDDKWHHLALTYDSYRYILKFYVDGQEKQSARYFWIKDGEEPNRLEIKNELNGIELDDLGLWEGTLTATEIKKIYEDSLIK